MRHGNTIDFLLCAKRDAKAAKRFLRKALHALHASSPARVINVDQHAAYSAPSWTYRRKVCS
jgi:transposase-like protein